MKRMRTGVGLLVLSLVVAVSLAACGSSGSSSTSTPSSAAPSSSTGAGAAASTGGSSKQVVVGVIGAFSGLAGTTEAGVPQILGAWEKTVNAGGGINGAQVKVVVDDDGTGTPQTALADATKLISGDHAVALLDFDVNFDSVWLPVATKANVPVIVAADSVAGLKDADAFPVIPSTITLGYAFAATAKQYGSKTGVSYCSEAAVCAAQGAAIKVFGGPLGVKLSASIASSSTASDYTNVCQGFQQSGANSYSLVYASAAAATITNDCYQSGVKIPQILLGPGAEPAWKTDAAYTGDPAIDGVAPFFEDSTPAQKQYRRALTTMTTHIVGTTLDNSITLFGWAAAQLFLDAAKTQHGALTPASVLTGLYSLKGDDLGGLTEPLTYTKGQPTLLNCWFEWKVAKGSYELGSSGDKPICAAKAAIAAGAPKLGG